MIAAAIRQPFDTTTGRKVAALPAESGPVTGAVAAGPGMTVWLTGLSGAGKTTIADAVAAELRAAGRKVEVLDGDELRRGLSAGLGFSREDRDTHVRRVGFVAELLARNGVVALVPVIAPYTATRDEVRALHAARDTAYLEVYVATPLGECARRDVKGLYAKAAAGIVTRMTGVDDPYEEPEKPDLRLDTTRIDVATAAGLVLDLLAERPAAEPCGSPEQAAG